MNKFLKPLLLVLATSLAVLFHGVVIADVNSESGRIVDSRCFQLKDGEVNWYYKNTRVDMNNLSAEESFNNFDYACDRTGEISIFELCYETTELVSGNLRYPFGCGYVVKGTSTALTRKVEKANLGAELYEFLVKHKFVERRTDYLFDPNMRRHVWMSSYLYLEAMTAHVKASAKQAKRQN